MLPITDDAPQASTHSVNPLIDRFQKGERAVFGEIWAPVEPVVFSFLYCRTNHREDARDLTQTTSLKLLEHLDKRGDAVDDIKRYCLGIARHLVIDNHRRRKNDPLKRASEFSEQNSSESEQKRAEVLARLREEVKEVLSQLSDEDRNLLYAYYFEAKTREEIATTKNCSPSYVGRLLNKIRHTLAGRSDWTA